MIRFFGYVLMLALLVGLVLNFFAAPLTAGVIWSLLQYATLVLTVVTALLLLFAIKDVVSGDLKALGNNGVAIVLFIATLSISYLLQPSLFKKFAQYL